MTTATGAKTIPVVEMFGPTIQGEGMLAGAPTHFVRVGYCDFRCVWCDSLFSVLPELVREEKLELTPRDILNVVAGFEKGPEWITISGGNPAMHDLQGLVNMLHGAGWLVSVETQGSIWREWLADVDALTVSPKPPSSGMVNSKHTNLMAGFLYRASAMDTENRSLKIVVFDEDDYTWASNVLKSYPDWQAFLSVGTNPPEPNESLHETRRLICDRYAWLCDKVSADPWMQRVRVYPQLHALAWGHARAV